MEQVKVLDSEEIDAGAVAERLEKRREECGRRSSAASATRQRGVVAKAPAEVVEEERGKLGRTAPS